MMKRKTCDKCKYWKRGYYVYGSISLGECTLTSKTGSVSLTAPDATCDNFKSKKKI